MIERLWHEWNWSGIGFVAVMTAFVLSTGWATRKIQRWAERPDNKKRGRTLEAAIEEALQRREQDKWDGLGNRIDSHNYAAPYHAMHTIDFERSQFMVRPDGAVVAGCAVQGCGVVTVIGRRVANAIVVEDGRMS